MNSAGVIVGLLASVFIVLTGLATVARIIWRIAVTVRDNTSAVRSLISEFASFRASVDDRLGRLERRRRF